MSQAVTTRKHVLADFIPRSTNLALTALREVALVLAGVALVALLAKASVPLWPVPITGQTLGVLLVGAALGSTRGAVTMTSYMLTGLAGVPVFAGAVAGPAYVLSPSFGFIIGFIPAAFVAGWCAERAWDRRFGSATVGFVLASAIPFFVGLPYMWLILATVSGNTLSLWQLLEAGLFPFIIGGIIKAVVAAVLIGTCWRLAKWTKQR